LQQLEKLVQRQQSHRGKEDRPPEDLPQRIDLLRICIDLLTDRLADAHQGAEQWLATRKSSDPHNVGSVYCVKTICLMCFFRFAQARQTMRTAQQILLEIGGAVAIGWVHLVNGTISIYEGSYADAYKELLAGLSRIRGELGEDSILSDTLALAAAKCAVEMGLNEEARSLLHQGLRSAHGHGLVGTTACGFDAAVAFWNGGENEIVSIPQLRETASSYTKRLSLRLTCFIVPRFLRLGRVEDALVEARRIGLGDEIGDVGMLDVEELEKPRYRVVFMATQIDLHLAAHRYKQAEVLIAKEYQLAQLDGRTARLVELGLTRAAVEINGGNTANAEAELTLAVGRAARQRIMRPFLDRAETVSRIVNDTKPSAWSFPQREEREFFAGICKSLPISNRLLHDWSDLLVADQNSLNAPTKRESELLSMLDMGLSNQQIADYSSVSITTVKWHLQNLYRKFGVANRSAALARARALNLLPK
jgi:LuxR family maltose regulon positive regulatory protein